MADEPNQDSATPENDPIEDQPVPIEEEDAIEEELSIPRRAASAQFVVQAEVGSAAALREAMDPANQSLADALKLSFRVLQIVIVALMLLFIFSGFQSVDAKESGVMLRWGKIVVKEGAPTALTPGPHWTIWPYPAGEFVIFETEDRDVEMRKSVDLGFQEIMVDPFWPFIQPGVTREQVIDNANISDSINPASKGSVLTRDGDIAHLKISANFDIEDPVEFVQTLSQDDAQQAVSLALRRAVVHVVAESSLEELIDFPEDIKVRVQASAQSVLDRFGITLDTVTVIETSPPFAIAKAYGELPAAREQAKQTIQKALEEKEGQLTDTAGESYRQLVQLIEAYEDAEKQDSVEDPEKVLAQINTFLDGEKLGGGLSQVIDRAKAHDADIDLGLGAEVRRFKRILPEYRDNPKMTIDRRWLEAYQTVMRRADTEVMYMPKGLGELYVKIKTIEEASIRRQQMALARKTRQTDRESLKNRGKYYESAEDYETGMARPSLIIKDGKVVPRAADN